MVSEGQRSAREAIVIVPRSMSELLLLLLMLYVVKLEPLEDCCSWDIPLRPPTPPPTISHSICTIGIDPEESEHGSRHF